MPRVGATLAQYWSQASANNQLQSHAEGWCSTGTVLEPSMGQQPTSESYRGLAQHWHNTGEVLGPSVVSRGCAALAQHYYSTGAEFRPTTDFRVMPRVGAALAQCWSQASANNQLQSHSKGWCSTGIVQPQS